MLERPCLIDHPPARVSLEDRAGVFEIRFIVRAKKNPGARGGSSVDQIEKFGLDEAMLVVPFLRPWIGEKDKHIAESEAERQNFEKESGIRAEKMKLMGFGPLLLSRRTLDAITLDIETNAKRRRMRLRIGDEKMPVATAELAYELSGSRKNLREGLLKRFFALLHDGEKARCADAIFHGGERTYSPPNPLPDSTHTIRMLMSAGLTPLMRLACPSVIGLISNSFCALSLRRPLTER